MLHAKYSPALFVFVCNCLSAIHSYVHYSIQFVSMKHDNFLKLVIRFLKLLLFTRCANSNGFCRCFHPNRHRHDIIRHFQFRKCLIPCTATLNYRVFLRPVTEASASEITHSSINIEGRCSDRRISCHSFPTPNVGSANELAAAATALFLCSFFAGNVLAHTVSSFPSLTAEALPASASCDNWGLSFQQEGKPPVANATSDYLKQFQAHYIADTTESCHLPDLRCRLRKRKHRRDSGCPEKASCPGRLLSGWQLIWKPARSW